MLIFPYTVAAGIRLTGGGGIGRHRVTCYKREPKTLNALQEPVSLSTSQRASVRDILSGKDIDHRRPSLPRLSPPMAQIALASMT